MPNNHNPKSDISQKTIQEWIYNGICPAKDGCLVELDGYCPHGHPSLLIEIGFFDPEFK